VIGTLAVDGWASGTARRGLGEAAACLSFCHGLYGLTSICDENANFKNFILQQFTAYVQAIHSICTATQNMNN